MFASGDGRASVSAVSAKRAPRGQTVAILYPGHLGHALAKRHLARGHRVVTTLGGRSTATRRRAAGLEVLGSLKDVVAVADVIVSVVVPAAAVDVARAVLGAAEGGHKRPLYIDANATDRKQMLEIDALLRPTGMRVTDAVIMGPAYDLARARLHLSGRHNAESIAVFAGVLEAVPFSKRVGDASAFKLTSSSFLKAVAALLFEVAACARRQKCLPQMLDELRRFGTLASFIDEVMPTYASHAERRALELRSAANMAAEDGFEPLMVRAAADIIDRVSRADPGRARVETAEQLLGRIAGSGALSRLRATRKPR